ncbi:MAG: NlpC/P60 family protein [Anaeromyxobacteraceae bacterium]
MPYMSAFRPGVLAAALALSLGCAGGMGRTRHARLPPPARENRAGAPTRSAGPDSGSRPSTAALATARATGDERERAVATATALVGRRTIVVGNVDYGADCAALVRAAFDQAGRPLPADARDAAALYAYALRRGAFAVPRLASPGDVVFLADRPGGRPAHVGLVARTDGDGTALVLHRVARGVQRVRVDLGAGDRQTPVDASHRQDDALLIAGRSVPASRLVIATADLLRPAR